MNSNFSYNTRKFISPNIGGKNKLNSVQFNNQLNVLNKIEDINCNRNNTSSSNDEYNNYLVKNGLSCNDMEKKLDYHYINIDSNNRNKLPKVDIEESILLDNDPLIFRNNNENIFIRNFNNNFNVGDKITLTGLKSKNVTLKTIVKNTTNINNSNTNLHLFTFENESIYVKILYNHELPPSYIYKNSSEMVEIEIVGFRGNSSSNYYENIPISLINKKHKVYLVKKEREELNSLSNQELRDVYDQYNTRYFFIKLNKQFKNNSLDIIDDTNRYEKINTSYNVMIKFNYFAGIPLNYLNAKYPVSKNNLNGFHVVTQVEPNGFSFKPLILPQFEAETDRVITADNNLTPSGNILEIKRGGNNIIVSKISRLYSGYSSPNKYVISLGKIYKNVYSIKIINSIFPKTEYTVRDSSNSNPNNKIYWENLNESLSDENESFYFAEIPQGNYDLESLIDILKTEMNKVQRNIITNNSITNSHNFEIDFNKNTNLVTFKSYKKTILNKPFIGLSKIDPELNLFSNYNNIIDGTYTIIIKHNNHEFLDRSLIKIKNSLDYLGISKEDINTEYNIRLLNKIEVLINNPLYPGSSDIPYIVGENETNAKIKSYIDIIKNNENSNEQNNYYFKNYYIITLRNINLQLNSYDNNGGVNVEINTPDYFRLKFNYSDTLGKYLDLETLDIQHQ